MWIWGNAQIEAFQAVQKTLSSSHILAFYRPDRETMVTADASAFGVGGVIFQNNWMVHRSPLLLPHVPSQPQSTDMYKLRRRHLLLSGLVSGLAITS